MTRYRWVAARKAEGFPITAACKVAEVSTTAFDDWRRRGAAGPSDAECAEAALVAAIREIHDETDGTYGEPRMTPELRDRGWAVNHKRVERLMRVHGIVGVHKPPRVRTTIPAEHAPPLPDLIGRLFDPGAPDVAWVGDITYIPTGEGWLYLASVLDLGSRRWLGYSMADHMRTELVADALRMAAGARGGVTEGIIFHGDRGSQYMSGEYRDLIAQLGMVQSVGRTGVCWDNSVAEAAWSSLKRELVHRYQFPDRASARRAIFAWINRYNTSRRHSSLGYIPPTKWESRYCPTQANQAA
ncbi:MAG TPA: IS3 family transposase [Acidimicrobiales bacterium]|nr:IS3 family transposase [Acidimicrobiales bacterium]